MERPKISSARKAGFYIIVCSVPTILTGLFYLLRMNTEAMDTIGQGFAAPVRAFLGLVSSVVPFSMAEILCTLAVGWSVYYLTAAIVKTIRAKGERVKTLVRRLAILVVTALYVWSAFCWLWGSAYYETGFAAKNGFNAQGVTSAELGYTARLFLDKANELAPLINRDADGHYNENLREIFDNSASIYDNMTFNGLGGTHYKPKSMIYSWLFSRTGYTGFYFGLTGEANINTDAPGCLIPATIAHELAHQCGVSSEAEANFVAVAACTSSGDIVYAYSGYLMGLMSLMNALYTDDMEAWFVLRGEFSPELEQDWNDNSEYWQAQKKVETGVTFIDETLTAAAETASEAVTVFYDGYLKSYGQKLGIRSYGAYVNLLVEYFT